MTDTALTRTSSTDFALLEAESQRVLASRARSFRWGQVLLPDVTAREVAIAYAFCRLVDDTADDAPDADVARRDLDLIRKELVGDAPARPLVAAYRALEARRGIDRGAALELLKGMRSDLDGVRVQDDEELLLYAYRAAGTVGIMMCGMLGVDDRRGLAHAIDLGIAMQLTNIARDVAEDAGLGRVYLPASRLAKLGVTHDEILAGTADKVRVFAVVKDIVALAERYYASAFAGMRFIPWHARAAIVVAARLYRAIGLEVVRRGPTSVTTRTVVTPLMKTSLAVAAVIEWLLSGVGIGPSSTTHARELHTPLKGLPGVVHH